MTLQLARPNAKLTATIAGLLIMGGHTLRNGVSYGQVAMPVRLWIVTRGSAGPMATLGYTLTSTTDRGQPRRQPPRRHLPIVDKGIAQLLDFTKSMEEAPAMGKPTNGQTARHLTTASYSAQPTINARP
jgi:hypothetical protein